MIKREVAEDFKKDIASHEMTVKLDQGLYRHLVFRKPQHGWHHWFEIVTYPGRLVIGGDMGTWVFSRLEDMFEFFRTDREPNFDYWAEKICAGNESGRRQAKVYDGDAYKARIIDRLIDCEFEPKQHEKYRQQLEELDWEDKQTIYRQVDDLDIFTDLWETDMKVYSYHYMWCCHAILWGIREYDKATAS